VLMESRNGKRVVVWPNLIALSFVLSMTIGLGTGAVFYLLAGQWQHFPVLQGIAVGLGMVGAGLVKGLRTPTADVRNPE
jgi:hypothetical protein